MELETSRKRASDGVVCDPALQRLQKAARAIAVAQKLGASKKPSPTPPPPSTSGNSSSFKQHKGTLTTINVDGSPKFGTKQRRENQEEPWTASPISPPPSSASFSNTSRRTLDVSDAVVTPPKRHQVMAQKVSRHSPSVAITTPTQRRHEPGPVDTPQQWKQATNVASKKSRQASNHKSTVKAPDAVRASVIKGSHSHGNRRPAVKTVTLKTQHSAENRSDRAHNTNSRIRVEKAFASYASSLFDRVLRFLQLCVPFIVLLAVPQTIPFSIHESLVSTSHTDTTLTLRDVITDQDTGFHLAMAPAFFGFYGYFGALAAWYDVEPNPPIHSLAGASAGAMVAVLIGAGIAPQTAADFCSEMTVSRFADFPGFGGIFRGHKFERIMDEFLHTATNRTNVGSWKLEEAILPVAVTAFDLQTLQGKILTTGSMAKAARASATFPLLFQPVGWVDGASPNDYVFIDGGITDPNGLVGLTKTIAPSTSRRIVNLSIGSLVPVRPPFDASSTEIIAVSIVGLPRPSPFAMHKGSKAYKKARKAMMAALDTPLKRRGDGYELTIQAESF